MASIMTGIQLQDNFSSVLYGIIDTVNIAVASMYDMSEAMSADVDTSSLQAAQDRIAQTTAALDRMNAAIESPSVPGNAAKESADALNRSINNNIQAQSRFNNTVAACQPKVAQVESGFKGWEKAIIVANNAIGLVENVLGKAGVMDMSGAFGRIDTMNRFQKTITTITGDSDLASAALTKLNDLVLGTAYGLDVASRSTQGFVTRGMSLGAATEQVRIWADAVSFYGEGTNEQLEGVVDAIGKMYSKGTVEADQLDRLFDAGIGAAEIYANAVGASVSDVKESLSDGTISAAQFIETVSQAMDAGLSSGAAKNAGATWATTFANVGAAINRGWVEIIENLDAELASRGLPSTMEMVQMFGQTIENTLDTIAGYMGMVVDLAVGVGDAMGQAGSFIADNWSIISPFVYAVVAALAAYAVISGIVAVANGVMATSQAIHAAQTMLATGATFAQTAAQYGLNAALAACPLTWIILLIIALIAAIVAVCSYIAKTSDVATSAFGVMTGGINVVIQFFKNLGLEVANIAIGIWNAMCACADNIGIAFRNTIRGVQSWFYSLLATALTVIGGICEELNKLPFIEFDFSGITSKAEEYAAKALELQENKEDYASVVAEFNRGMGTYEVFGAGWASEAFQQGAAWGDGISDKVSDKLSEIKGFFNPDDFLGGKNENVQKDYSSILGDTSLTDNMNDIAGNIAGNTGDIAGNTGALDDIAGNTGNTAEDTARIADAVEITDEDLKYLRDIAEREIIDRTVFTKVEVNMGGISNEVHNMTDLDAIPDYINSVLQEKIAISAEG